MSGDLKQDIIFRIFKQQASEGSDIFGGGVLEILNDGFGFLRSTENSYCTSADDIYVSPSQVRKFALRKGDEVQGKDKAAQGSRKIFCACQIDTINGETPDKAKKKILFENLTLFFLIID